MPNSTEDEPIAEHATPTTLQTLPPEIVDEIAAWSVSDAAIMLNEIPTGHLQELDPDSLELLTIGANLLPLRSSTRRTEIAAEILGYEFEAFPNGAISNLISNLEYLRPDERSRVLERVCAFHEYLAQEEFGISPADESLVTQAVKKAERLTPADRSRLVAVACAFSPERRSTSLEPWAENAHLLTEAEQSRVLSQVYENSVKKGRSLACFAQHFDRLSPESQRTLLDQVIALPAEEEGKWLALSHIAEHLPDLAQPDRDRVANYIFENHASGIEEICDPYDQPEWYSKAEFCRIEALHHLAVHGGSLNAAHQQMIETLVTEMTNQSGPQHLAIQAQLISHLPKERRHDVVSTALDHGSAQHRGVVYALTVHMKDLNEAERAKFISKNTSKLNPSISSIPDGSRIDYYVSSSNSTEYNIRNNLECFTPEQRTLLVERHLEFTTGDSNYRNAAPALADLAQQARYLRIHDIESIVKAADRTVRRNIDDIGEMDDDEKADLASCSREAVRCLATWTGEAFCSSREAKRLTPPVLRALRSRPMSTSFDGASDTRTVAEVQYSLSPTAPYFNSEDDRSTDTAISLDHEAGSSSRTGPPASERQIGKRRRDETHADQHYTDAGQRRRKLGDSRSSDDEGTASSSGPSHPAGRIAKHGRNETSVDPCSNTSSSDEPRQQHPRLENRVRSRSPTNEL